MSIDARIAEVVKAHKNLILKLEPRIDKQGHSSIAGQPSLTIIDYTKTPSKGMEIWGGDGEVEIVKFGVYDRLGYTRLREKKWLKD